MYKVYTKQKVFSFFMALALAVGLCISLPQNVKAAFSETFTAEKVGGLGWLEAALGFYLTASTGDADTLTITGSDLAHPDASTSEAYGNRIYLGYKGASMEPSDKTISLSKVALYTIFGVSSRDNHTSVNPQVSTLGGIEQGYSGMSVTNNTITINAGKVSRLINGGSVQTDGDTGAVGTSADNNAVILGDIRALTPDALDLTEGKEFSGGVGATSHAGTVAPESSTGNTLHLAYPIIMDLSDSNVEGFQAYTFTFNDITTLSSEPFLTAQKITFGTDDIVFNFVDMTGIAKNTENTRDLLKATEASNSDLQAAFDNNKIKIREGSYFEISGGLTSVKRISNNR